MINRHFADFVLAYATLLAVMTQGIRAVVEWANPDMRFEWRKEAVLAAAVVALLGVTRYLVLIFQKERGER